VLTSIYFEALCNSILIENIVQLAGIDSKAVLIPHIDCNYAILTQTFDGLIHKGERRVRSPFHENIRLDRVVFDRKVKIEGRVLCTCAASRTERIELLALKNRTHAVSRQCLFV